MTIRRKDVHFVKMSACHENLCTVKTEKNGTSSTQRIVLDDG